MYLRKTFTYFSCTYGKLLLYVFNDVRFGFDFSTQFFVCDKTKKLIPTWHTLLLLAETPA